MANSFFDTIYKNKTQHTPDVLSCLSNLSNDEVFTPPDVVNQMLDLLPQELFTDPNTTFLDPACKTGVFLREIAKRLLVGLEDKIPDLQERIDHIFHKQLYGIAITELTSLLSRRSLYCSKYPNGPYSITEFDNPEGNIRFRKIEHVWGRITYDKDGNPQAKCKYCGASMEKWNREDTLETYAYELIHTDNPERLFNMKFDVIISNPPYQMNDGGGTDDSAKPLYHLFIESAKKLNPRYISMIVPSRWMKGGKGLDKFRETMMRDTSISKIVDFEKAEDCFSGVHIDGGVCYFLWDSLYNGDCYFKHICADGSENISMRKLQTDLTNTIIRDSRQISIIEKVVNKQGNMFDSIVSSRKPYGIATDLFNTPEKYPQSKLSFTADKGKLKIYGVKGKKGGAKRLFGYVDPSFVTQNKDEIGKYKILFSYAYTTTASIPPEPIIAKPNEVSTETFLRIGPFNTESEVRNCLSYIKTKFFRALLLFNRSQKNASSKTFCLIPIQDFSKPWTDEELYAKYNLSQEEINFIETMIKPME